MRTLAILLAAVLGLAARGFEVADGDEGLGTYFVPATGTANVAAKTKMRPGAVKKTVAFLGGSITEMDGFRPRVMNLLRVKYPEVDFEEIAAGLSSTCSDAGAFRLEEDVLSKGAPDLFIVEAAVNDDQDGHFSEQRCIRGMEGCVRQVRLRRPECAVVIGLMVNRDQYQLLTNGVMPLQYRAHARVATHYGAALADIGSALAAEAAKGGMTWEAYRDCHPSPEGCDFVAKVVMEAIDKVFVPVKSVQMGPLPEPLDDLSYFRAQTVPPEKVRLGAGWQVSVPDWRNIPGVKRDYFTSGPAVWSETEGSELSFDFSGTAVSAFLTAGPDAGNLEVSVDGEEFRLLELQANYGALHYPYVQPLADDLVDGPHTVKLRVKAALRNGKSYSAVRIHRLYVNGTIIGSLQGQSPAGGL